jgi:hypothetical protein
MAVSDTRVLYGKSRQYYLLCLNGLIIIFSLRKMIFGYVISSFTRLDIDLYYPIKIDTLCHLTSFVKSVLLKRLFVLCNRCRIFSIFGCLSFLLLLVTAYQLISLIISDSMHYANFITVNTLKVLYYIKQTNVLTTQISQN